MPIHTSMPSSSMICAYFLGEPRLEQDLPGEFFDRGEFRGDLRGVCDLPSAFLTVGETVGEPARGDVSSVRGELSWMTETAHATRFETEASSYVAFDAPHSKPSHEHRCLCEDRRFSMRQWLLHVITAPTTGHKSRIPADL